MTNTLPTFPAVSRNLTLPDTRHEVLIRRDMRPGNSLTRHRRAIDTSGPRYFQKMHDVDRQARHTRLTS
jgi:hypothetical protein